MMKVGVVITCLLVTLTNGHPLPFRLVDICRVVQHFYCWVRLLLQCSVTRYPMTLTLLCGSRVALDTRPMAMAGRMSNTSTDIS